MVEDNGEPQGVGAVVHDRDGARWVHAAGVPGGANWVRYSRSSEGHAWRGFKDIDVVVVVSAGTGEGTDDG